MRHIYGLSAWLVTQGCRKLHERPQRTEHHALMSRLQVWIFYEKWYSGSNPYGHGSSCHPWQRPPVANFLFAPPCLSALFKKISTPSDRHRGMTFRPPWAFCVLKIPWKISKPNSCYWFLYSSQVIYILNSCFKILYMCFRKYFTHLFSVLAYFTCVFPAIIHAWSLFFAYRYVFPDLLYIPNSCFLSCLHVFPTFLHIPNSCFWIVRMYFLIFRTY